MQLPSSVRQYYIANFDTLSFDKKFHFAGRLYSWEHNTFCGSYLQNIQTTMIGAPEKISTDLYDLLHNPPAAKINAAAARQPYFDAYPTLRGRMLALFRVRHLLSVYQYDARDILLAQVSKQELTELAQALAKDTEALKTLSTYAINYLYLIDILFPDISTSIDTEHYLAIGSSYDLVAAENIQLFIYFYTHMIIGDSNFYEQPVHPSRLADYRRMLAQIESTITDNFTAINLDNKLEFLVCCRICTFDTVLFERIYAECEASLSEEGTFLVDTINNFKQSQKTSFSDSEHRNVLYIMSTSPYTRASDAR